MESEKVKEIKKVLEEGQFNTINHHQKEGKPIKISFADILTLINELESENKLLRNAKVVYENVDYCYEDLKKAEKRIAELEKIYDRQVRIINDLNIEVVKMQEKLPKFAERLKEKLFDLGNIVNDNDIDETLKEFLE